MMVVPRIFHCLFRNSRSAVDSVVLTNAIFHYHFFREGCRMVFDSNYSDSIEVDDSSVLDCEYGPQIIFVATGNEHAALSSISSSITTSLKV
mmetsp:Transcript_29500/g.63253  ORF Transcript_29500/g.63253 Transcript_29500/m.63253 type:complete len:92 (+) Transcript_29500:1801-2076(+)